MRTAELSSCVVMDLGLIAYEQAHALQQEYVKDVIGGGGQRLLLCEHPPVITTGRMTDLANLLFPPEELARRNVRVRAADRGGDVTLHAPGQLVAYPILNLANFGKDLHAYLHTLEDTGIDLLRQFGILAARNPANTGLWAGGNKIMSIGIGVRRWVAFHGLGLNVNTDLSLFSLIRPCGLDVTMTSMQRLKGRAVDMAAVKSGLIDCFQKRFHLKLVGYEAGQAFGGKGGVNPRD